MQPFASQLADLHRQDLLREAEVDRRIQLARLAIFAASAWRRRAGRVVDAAGHVLEAAAWRLDPSVHGTDRTRLDLAH